MMKGIRSNQWVRHTLALTVVLGVGVAGMSAQTTTQDAAAEPALTVQAPVPDASQAQLFSSSADENAASPTLQASLHPGVNFAEMMQYGGGQRSRYGRPRYRGANTNPDGSAKYTGFGGVGFTQPIGNTYHYDTPSYSFQVGFGRQFSKHFALPVQFDWDNFGLAGQTLGNQLNLYNNDTNYFCSVYPSYCAEYDVTDLSSLDGNAHVWSFSIDPTYTFLNAEHGGIGAYVVAGVGFYHKVTNFTTPEVEETYFGDYEANQIIDHYTSNAPGFSAGFGITYKFSHFSNERLYGEVRYVFIDNSYRPGVTVNSPVATTYEATNDYSANSNHTTYFPVKFGIRF